MLTPRSLALSFGLTCSALAASGFAQTAAPLRMTYVAGTHTNYVTHSVQRAPAPMGETNTTGHVSIETVAVTPDGSAQQRVRLTGMDVQGAQVNAQARQAIASGLNGMAMTYTQDSRGHVVHRDEPTGVSPQFRPLVDGLMQSLDQLSPQLPDQPVSIGSTWNDHRTTHVTLGPGLAMDLTINVTYTLTELRHGAHGDTAVIGLAMAMQIAAPQQGPSQVSMSGEGTATGSMTLLLHTGMLTESRSTGSMNMHVSAQGRTQDVATTFQNDMRPEAGAAAGHPAH